MVIKSRVVLNIVLYFTNKTSIVWYSKRQDTLESFKVCSEFVALGVASELIISLRYKIGMFGIPILDHADVFCDNEDLHKNTAFAESTLRNKNNSILFHCVRECVDAGIMIFHKVHNKYNFTDILTK